NAWYINYKLMYQLGDHMPVAACTGLRAVESFDRDVWPGSPNPGLGHPYLKSNILNDMFQPALLSPDHQEGNGHQIITIDHLVREHDIRIPLFSEKVILENVVTKINQ
ncbi:MAG: hypothetical protein HPZ91_01015, partial [Lentisphaeria bacterium]|nr:hypothetical protein [Lentisphaeria bacterium]